MNRLLSVFCATAALLMAAPAMALPAVGKAAPDFEATDTHGKAVKLSELKGKPVVLEWNNPECPFVVKHYDSGNMQKLQENAAANGVVWLTINSSAAGKQGHLDTDAANAYITKTGAKQAHFLLDHDGAIGKLYGAKVTPHMFVINKDGVLAYDGAIDSKNTADQADIESSTNYVTAALDALAAGKDVEVTNSQPYGCGVKY